MAKTDWLTQLHHELVILNNTKQPTLQYTRLRRIIREAVLDKRDSRIVANLWRKLYDLDNTL